MSKALTLKETNELVEVVGSYSLEDVNDLKKLDTNFIIEVAKSIIDITKRISEDAEFSKQYELGKIFNAAALAVKSGNKRIKMKDVQASLGFPQRTWDFHIEFYLDHTNFNKILSLNKDLKISLPKYTINRGLKGNDSEDKLSNYINICDYVGKTPTSKEVLLFNKKAKTISEDVWTVTAEEVKYLDESEAEETEETEEETEEIPTVTKYDELTPQEKNEALNDYYFEKSGVNVRELTEDNDLEFIRTVPDQMFQIIKAMEQKEWKKMFRKGALQFSSDTGNGTDKEAMLWKAFANVVEDAYNNVEYEGKEDFFKLHNGKMREIKVNEIKEWFNKKETK